MNSENRYIEENKDIEGMECDADDGKYLQNENTPWRESSGRIIEMMDTQSSNVNTNRAIKRTQEIMDTDDRKKMKMDISDDSSDMCYETLSAENSGASSQMPREERTKSGESNAWQLYYSDQNSDTLDVSNLNLTTTRYNMILPYLPINQILRIDENMNVTK